MLFQHLFESLQTTFIRLTRLLNGVGCLGGSRFWPLHFIRRFYDSYSYEIVPLTIHSEPLDRQIPHARLTVLKGAGHMPHHSHERDVIASVDRVAKAAGLR